MRILFISCLLWTILFTRQVKGESKCLRTNRQPDRMCVTKCDPLTGCRAEEKCLCDGDCGYSCVKRDLSCGRPPRVSNARPQYPATNFSSVVTYVCNEDHALSGAAKRTCRANGRWDGVGPNCLKMCSLPTIPFSTYIAKPVNYTRKYRTGERITLACKKGFKKKPGGNPVRICISGLWTRFPFQCEGTHACKRTIRAPRTKCTQECSPQSGCGSDKYKCLCDGSCGFSCVEIGMSCGNPPSISNGNLVYNNTSYNSTAHYSCNEGYNLNTAPVKRCTAKKRWEGLTPRCLKDCKPPTIPRNANISNPSKKYHSGYKVTFKCNEGYNQEGMATQMCFLGSWTVLPFKCTEGGCGDPGTPENGRKLGVTYSVNSKVYFDCDLGYELEGSADRKCQLNGTWTGIQPVCKAPLCDKPNIPDEAAVIYPRSMDREFKYGDRVLLKCKEGYFKSGLGVYQCKKGNRWSGGITCSPKNCGRPNDIPNGKIIGYVYSFKEKIRYECNEGYNLKGPSYRTCQANEKWGDKDPICEVVDCGPLQKPDHGDIIEQVAFTYGNRIVFDCTETGYEMKGSRVRTCLSDGTWSGSLTTCEAPCARPTIPVNGKVVGNIFSHGKSVNFYCDSGYKRVGARSIKCDDGKWDKPSPVCKGICSTPRDPQNGKLHQKVPPERFLDGDEAKFFCNSGYDLIGKKKLRCVGKVWDSSEPECKAMSCGNPPSITNGNVVYNDTSYNSTAHYTCNEGYSLNTAPVKRCTSKKRWEGLTPRCLQDCKPPTIPINARISNPSNKYHSGYKVTFKCNEGYNQEGMATQMCFLGSWTVLPFKCTGACNAVLGMHNKKIQDSSITASSQLSLNHVPSLARLDSVQGAWCSAPTDNLPYIEILLSEEKFLTLIKTQGSKKDLRWATKYEIQYQKDGQWIVYRKTDGTRTFDGNVGVTSLNAIALQPRIRTRSVRIYPKFPLSLDGDASLMNVSCLRLELYGCSAPVDGLWGA